MSEEHPEAPGDHVGERSGHAAGPPSTGHPAVDEVLRSLAELEQTPVTEHVAVFTTAHERLRSALDEASGSAAEPDPDD